METGESLLCVWLKKIIKKNTLICNIHTGITPDHVPITYVIVRICDMKNTVFVNNVFQDKSTIT